MRLGCPYCGERWNDEFIVLGDADALMKRPREPKFELFHDYVYLRTNRAGQHRELWYHQAGCRQWLVVTRDTLSHAVHSVETARQMARDASAAS